LTFATASNGNFVSGTVNGTFSDEYDKAAKFEKIEILIPPDWGESNQQDIFFSINDMTVESLKARESDKSYRMESTKTPTTIFCTHSGSVEISASGKNVYVLSDESIIDFTVPCTGLANTVGYSGFLTVVDGSNVDDTLWYVVSNGMFSTFTILTR